MTALDALDFNNTAPPKRQRVTQAEYWDQYYNAPDITYEWNNGNLEVKAVSDQLTISMYKWFLEVLEHYLKTNQIAESTLLEMGFILTLPQKNEVRKPDLGVVLNSNPIPLLPSDRSYKGTFDLCVEAISDSSQQDIDRDIIYKKLEYAQAGFKNIIFWTGMIVI
jgi:Uma2 family endonuclease